MKAWEQLEVQLSHKEETASKVDESLMSLFSFQWEGQGATERPATLTLMLEKKERV